MSQDQEALWGIKCPDGHVDHTSLTFGTQAECTDKFVELRRCLLDQEREAYGLLGYSCVRVTLAEDTGG